MSFLPRTTITPLLRTAAARHGARTFTTSLPNRKIVPEPVKNAAKNVDRAVSDKIVDGIELGQKSAQKVKEATGMSEGELKGKAHEVAGQAKGKASELAGEAKGKKEEIKGKL